MTTVAGYFERAQLSLAAYAPLKQGMLGADNADYVAAHREGGMSQAQAEEFANRYSVIDQYTDPMTGFSGTAFLNVDTDQIHLAIRGSDDVSDWVGSNLGYVATDGIAITQGIAMFNWLQRLLGAPNSNVVQYAYVEEYFDQETGEFFPARIVSTVAEANGRLNDYIGSLGPISVTGHSLGGHLAMMLRVSRRILLAVPTLTTLPASIRSAPALPVRAFSAFSVVFPKRQSRVQYNLFGTLRLCRTRQLRVTLFTISAANRASLLVLNRLFSPKTPTKV